MAQSATIQATLLYEDLPRMDFGAIQKSLRALASVNGLPISGGSEVSEGLFRQSILPFEVTIHIRDEALPAATFNGALGTAGAGHRGPLGQIIVDHCAHLRIAVRDTGQTPCATDRTAISAATTLAKDHKALVFGQDVTRAVMKILPPAALHWHPSNQLVLPNDLMRADAGALHVPLCLRMRCTSAVIPDTAVVNMSQSIEGAQALLGKPLHVMATSLDRPTTMAMATAFVECMLKGDARPIGGAIFRDRQGNRVRVIDRDQCEGFENGLIALVEAEPSEKPQPSKSPAESADPIVAGSRVQVAAREARLRNDRAKRIAPEYISKIAKARQLGAQPDAHLQSVSAKLPPDILAEKREETPAQATPRRRMQENRRKNANRP